MLYKATHSKKPKMSLFTASMDKSAKTGGGAPHPTQYTPSGVGVGVGPDAVTGGFLKAMDMKDKTAIDEKGVESLSDGSEQVGGKGKTSDALEKHIRPADDFVVQKPPKCQRSYPAFSAQRRSL